MDLWFCKNLGDAMLAYRAMEDIAASFESAYTKENYPKEMAVFYRHESGGRLHCEVKVYFSPASARIAKELQAFPCEKPAKYGLSLLAGSPLALSILFPKTSGQRQSTTR